MSIKKGKDLRMEEKKQKKRGCFGCLPIVIIAILLIGGGIGFWYLRGVYKISKAEQLAGEYLNKKYNENFAVSNGKYIWATNSYTFDASPKDDPKFTFSVFLSNFYKGGIGDMYRNAWMGRETHKMLDPFINAISKNNYYGAMYGSSLSLSKEEEHYIETDIRRNNLTPLKAVRKYPGKIYLNTTIYYALDVTEQNRNDIFKKVYSLVKFLKKKEFGEIGIVIYFYPSNILNGKKIKEVYKSRENEFDDKHWRKRDYSIAIGTKALSTIKTWQDIGNHFDKWNSTTNKWEKVINISHKSNREITK